MKNVDADFYRVMAEETPDAVIVKSPDGKVVYWNPGAEKIFGFSAEEAVGSMLHELISPPALLDLEREIMREAIEGSTAAYESIRKRKDGSFVYLNTSSWADRDHDGTVRFIVTNMKDVTAAKIERDSKQVGARYGELLDSTPDAMLVVACTGHIVLANSLAEKMFGYEHSALRGHLIEALIPERFRGGHVGHRSGYFGQPRARVMGACLDLFGIRKDGTEFPVEISLSPLRMEGCTFAISAIRDVSDRKRAEQRFKSVLNAAPDSMFVVNTDGIIVLANSQTERFFGYGREELLGKSVDALYAERFRALRSAYRAKFFANPGAPGAGASIEISCLRKNGTEFPAEISLSPMTAEGEVLLISSIRDISQHKRLESEVAKRTRELEFAVKEMEAFSHAVSHDLSAPLRALTGFSQILKEVHADALEQPMSECLDRIHESAEKMGHLIQDLLRLSHVGRRELIYGTVNLSAAAEKIIDDLKRDFPDREVECVIASGLTAYADGNLLGIALDNLIRNAWKFTEKTAGARIEVGVKADPGEMKKINSPVFFVRDNGAGFDMNYAKKLFGPFQRLHTASEFKGTGIGLSIVRRIFARHDGKVWAEGKINGGATFYFMFPAEPADASA